MKIIHRLVTPLGNEKAGKKILSDIDHALKAVRTSGNKFIVNDTVWYWKNPTGQVMPTVVNSAKFITSRFQNSLKNERGWETEKRLLEQDVDAYTEIAGVFTLYRLDPSRFLDLLHAYETELQQSSGPIATPLFERYCKRQAPTLSKEMQQFNGFFERHSGALKLRCAIEFETGNVASSFRAANKLEYLFQEGEIDLGVFITCNDKPSCASRIWPISNRNGSFEELERRGFARALAVPLWQIGFAPDRFDQTVPYLAEDGSLYDMRPTGKTEKINGTVYEVWRDNRNQAKLRHRSGN